MITPWGARLSPNYTIVIDNLLTPLGVTWVSYLFCDEVQWKPTSMIQCDQSMTIIDKILWWKFQQYLNDRNRNSHSNG